MRKFLGNKASELRLHNQHNPSHKSRTARRACHRCLPIKQVKPAVKAASRAISLQVGFVDIS